jgi:hypothetical protein
VFQALALFFANGWFWWGSFAEAPGFMLGFTLARFRSR